MRALLIPIIAVGTMVVGGSNEPSEGAMRLAFEATLTAQVQGVLDYIAETGGPEALEKVREAGTDRFEIRSFAKLDCMRGEKPGHVCGFAVDVSTVGGSLQHTLTGRFFSGSRGLIFAHEA
jgi:hypothetical protein